MFQLLRPIFYIGGILVLIMAVLMLIPACFAYVIHDPELTPFLNSSAVTAVSGLVFILLSRERKIALATRQLYLLTTFSWMLLSLAGSLPLILAHHPLALVDAVFESVSGITTTGSTVMSQLQTLPPSILLWRSLLQWVGGLGVIGMAVSILPFLQIGGMKLFQTESSDWSDKSLPKFHGLARALLVSYILITMVCAVSYWMGGMSAFDAINHAMTTVSTGGYATDDRSMARFGPIILWISVLFMIVGALPLTFFIRFFPPRKIHPQVDQQITGFLLITGCMVFLLTIDLISDKGLPPFEALTQSAFNITSIITTTGYASSDYTNWGQFSIALFFIVTFIGGCSGSTSGGMKVFRFQLSYLFLMNQLKKQVHPHGIFMIKYNGKQIQDDITASAIAFSFMFFIALALTTLLLTAFGVDFLTSFTGAVTTLTNVGPGLGEVIGPAGNFSPLPDSAKWTLSFAMILGRLELLSVIVLFSTAFWNR